MNLTRVYTAEGEDLLKQVAFESLQAADGYTYIVPRHWGTAAGAVLAESVFYQGPVPAKRTTAHAAGVPAWLHPAETLADVAALAEGDISFERDFRDVLARIAGGLTYQGWRAGFFDHEKDAQVFHDELSYLILHRIALPETALLARAGLDWAYGLQLPGFLPGAQLSGLEDSNLGNAAGLLIGTDEKKRDLFTRVRLQAATLKLDDPEARLAVTLPIESIDAADFMTTRRQTDMDAITRGIGQRVLLDAMHHVMDACDRDSVMGFDPAVNKTLQRAMMAARASGLSDAAMARAINYAQQGFEEITLGDLPLSDVPDFAATLSVPDEFMEAALTGHGFAQKEAGAVVRHTDAQKLLTTLVDAIWSSGEPAVFFRDHAQAGSIWADHDTGNDIGQSGAGGLVFATGVAAPSGTVNVLACLRGDEMMVEPARIVQAAKILTLALEASFDIAAVSDKTLGYRPVCVNLANLSAFLMGSALGYDSDAGRTAAGLVTALVSGAAHLASAALADTIGACDAYASVAPSALSIMKARMAALSGGSMGSLAQAPAQLKMALAPDAHLVDAAKAVWDQAYALGKEQGFRHTHLTALAPDPPLEILLGAQSSGMAPEPGLVRFEGYFSDAGGAEIYGKKLNPMAARGLQRLGYDAAQIDDIFSYVVGQGTLLDAPVIHHAALEKLGFDTAALGRLESALKSAQHIRYVFNVWTLGTEFCAGLPAFKDVDIDAPDFDMLTALGFSEDEIDAANLFACGVMTLEGAPHLDPRQLAVFDCIVPPGLHSVRQIAPDAQLRMQAAVEPFLSGAAVHTVALQNFAELDDVKKLLLQAWELGVKSLRIYRNNCALSDPAALPFAVAPVQAEVPNVPSAIQENMPARAKQRAADKTGSRR